MYSARLFSKIDIKKLFSNSNPNTLDLDFLEKLLRLPTNALEEIMIEFEDLFPKTFPYQDQHYLFIEDACFFYRYYGLPFAKWLKHHKDDLEQKGDLEQTETSADKYFKLFLEETGLYSGQSDIFDHL